MVKEKRGRGGTRGSVVVGGRGGGMFFIKINWKERERSWFKEQLLLLL